MPTEPLKENEMTLSVVSPPAAEPLSLGEAKTHLRVDGSAEDSYISDLIVAARRWIENHTERVFVTQTLRMTLDRFPVGRALVLPRTPVQSVVHVKAFAADDAETLLAGSEYVVDGESAPARIVRAAGASWPNVGRAAKGVEVQFVAGYGANGADAPEELRHAARLLVAHFYERREAVTEKRPYEAPSSVAALIARFAPVRL